MKKIIALLIIASCFACNKTDDVFNEESIVDKMFVFVRNTDINTPDIFSKLFEIDPSNGEKLNEIGGFEKLQARLYYDIAYLKNKNELLFRRNVYEQGRGDELIKLNILTKEKKIIKIDKRIFRLTSLNNRLFGFLSKTNSVDLVALIVLLNLIVALLK